MQRLKQWELKRAIYEKKALAKPETAKQGPNCIVSQMEVSLFDVVVVGWQVEEVLVEELDMCFGFHHEVGFLQAAFGEERDVTIEDVYLAALLTDKL